MKRFASAACVVVLASCGRAAPPEPAPEAVSGSLPPGEVARVGLPPAALAVTAESVARIAAAQKVSVEQARDRAVRDAVFARAAMAEGLDRAPSTEAGVRGALARALLRQLGSEVERVPVTDTDIAEATEGHWLEVDRPEAFHAVHAVAQFKPNDDDAKKRSGNEVAEAIRRAVEPIAAKARAPDAVGDAPGAAFASLDALVTAFNAAAKAVPHPGVEVVAQELPPIASDGRFVTREGGGVHGEFARAAAQLEARGDLSAVVTSPSGAHVILLLERLPGQTFPLEERRARLHDVVINERWKTAEAELLGKLREQVAPSDPNVDALLGLVSIQTP